MYSMRTFCSLIVVRTWASGQKIALTDQYITYSRSIKPLTVLKYRSKPETTIDDEM